MTDAQQMISQGGKLVDSLARSVLDGLDAIGSMYERRGSCGCESHAAGSRGGGACSCEIPPPCWYPRHAGDVRSHVCPGGRAVLRIRVTNCGPRSARFTVRGAEKSSLEIEHPTLELGAMQRGTAVVKLDVTVEEQEHLIWVQGCHDHYIRWTVNETTRSGDACHEIDVSDCPDYLHHWYDHFYCAHPCQGRQDGGLVVAG
jgi:hypothetical protein